MVRNGDAHSLLLAATHSGTDLYCSLQGLAGPMLTSSYHQSGKGHTKVPGKIRLLDDDTVSLALFRGRVRLWKGQWPMDELDWNYKLRRDSDTRRSLVLEFDELSGSWSVEIWAIEACRSDLVDETLDEGEHIEPRFAHVLISWTQPQLLAVARSMRQKHLDAFRKSVEEHLFGQPRTSTNTMT